MYTGSSSYIFAVLIHCEAFLKGCSHAFKKIRHLCKQVTSSTHGALFARGPEAHRQAFATKKYPIVCDCNALTMSTKNCNSVSDGFNHSHERASALIRLKSQGLGIHLKQIHIPHPHEE